MRNVTILLAVLAMLAVTAQAALVDEDFSSDPGWTKSMGTGGSDFGYDNTAHAITGTWDRDVSTARYYTTAGGGIALDKDSAFSFKFDVTLPGDGDADANDNSMVMVGLMKTGDDNRTNWFGARLHYDNKGHLADDWELSADYYNAVGTMKTKVIIARGNLTEQTLHSIEFIYAVSGNLTVKVDGTSYDAGAGWNSTWSVNAFGTNNYDDRDDKATPDGVVIDNMVLVPEPATLALLGLGGIGVLIRRRRK